MNDPARTNQELIEENVLLKKRIQELEESEPEPKQIENALRESEEKFRTIFDRASDGIMIADAITKKFLQGNATICSMLGYTKEEIENLTVYDIHPPQDISRVLDEFEKQAKGEKGLAEDLPVLRKDGSIFYADIGTSPAIIEGVPCLVGIFRDITERKRAEEIIQEEKYLSESIINSLPGIFYLFDAQGKFQHWNRNLEIISGYSHKEILERHPSDFFAGKEKELLQQSIRDTFVNGEANVEAHFVSRDGAGTPFFFTGARIEINGQPHLVGMGVNITKRKKAEEELLHTLENLRRAVSTTIQVLVSAVEIRDPYTAGHQIRSAGLARAIATEMGLPPEKIEGIHMAGSIHDIGKLSIPAEILSKTTRLSELEFLMIKEHARRGFEMLKDVESPWSLAEMVYQHHERMDGSGYPRSLKGEEICMEARILAVSDVVESMASHRPYRPGLGIHAALEEIEKNSGIYYDNAVADACLRLFREKGFQLEGTRL